VRGEVVVAVTYQTKLLGYGNHAAIEIPDEVLAALGANRRAPLKVTIGTHSYQSTATGMDGKCLVVFPQRERDASGVAAGDVVNVTLELDAGRREVAIPEALAAALAASGLTETFEALSYSKRKEFARHVAEAKAEETRLRRVERVIAALTG
jgi:uncharacterized protein YdeI (YjbR/CyaY-like superfamily)